MLNKNYPNFFPKGCPPQDAIENEIEIFRLIQGDVVSKDDFKSQYELGKANNVTPESKLYFNKYGLSVNTNQAELEKMWRGNPHLKKKIKNIAKGITYKDTGVIKSTPSNGQKHHHTWWLCLNAAPEDYFEIQ